MFSSIQILTLKRLKIASGDAQMAPFSLEETETSEYATVSPVWRVAWNLTGTVLATSCLDGTLQLWRRDFNGNWLDVQTGPRQAGEENMSGY